ncbi:hypothetical protein ABT120_16670 [Nonomuraea angiospora]|uniref:hypothetical protein n=1 Tax=Nonomuraea angiospora TaxID=46172 RepID=UPI0033248A51
MISTAVRLPTTLCAHASQDDLHAAPGLCCDGGLDDGDGPLDGAGTLGAGIDAETNRVIVETNTFDQDLRHRLAERYGGLVVVKWDPFRQRMVLL